MATKYRTSNRFVSSKIEPFEVISETAHQIKYLDRGREKKENKVTEYSLWHNTLEGAKAFIVEKCEGEIRDAKTKIAEMQKIINTL